jgi:sugar phosphate isomerase/epimerase
MPNLKPREPGVMFWAERDPIETIAALGVRCGQLGFEPTYALTEENARRWRQDLAYHDFTLVTLFASYAGESYADIPTVEATVGFVPAQTYEERLARTLALSDFAAALGVGSIACHIGCIPADRKDERYGRALKAVRAVADHCAKYGQRFALETGQEPATALLGFLNEVERGNVGVNFDPANMILYGSGQPLAALRILAPRLVSVHLKDGLWPPSAPAGALGHEVPLGEGAVNIPAFVAELASLGFTGPLNVERETEDEAARRRDMARGIAVLRGLIGETQ